MSRPPVPIIIGTCLLASAMVAAIVLPRVWQDQSARSAMAPGIQQTIRTITDDTAHKEAQRISDDLTDAKHQHKAPPRDSATAARIAVDRAAFSITLPAGSTIDRSKSNTDAEHRLSVNLPAHGLLLILVNDRKGQAATMYDSVLAGLRKKVASAEEEGPDGFGSLRLVRATGLKGSLQGREFRYEIGQFEGWEKGGVILTEYPDEDRHEALPLLQSACETFRLKQ